MRFSNGGGVGLEVDHGRDSKRDGEAILTIAFGVVDGQVLPHILR
jgi:hypothetical protein